ncbi:zinc finger, CCHC-type containing protein [Tanacetum coccineum]
MMETFLSLWPWEKHIESTEQVDERKMHTTKVNDSHNKPEEYSNASAIAQYETAKEKFLPIVASIEQYSEIDEMSFEEAMGRIITFKERIKSQDEPEKNYQNKLLMASSSNQGKGRNFNKVEKGRERDKRQGEQSKNKMRCYNCGEFSHLAYECTKWKKKDKNEVSHLIYQSDDEPTLL